MTRAAGAAGTTRSGDRDERFVLAIDLGTGGPKFGLVSLTGRVAWNDHCPVETRWLPGGGAVQDAAGWWELIADATRRAMASGIVAAEQVEAVSCTGQWSSTVPVDERGIPVGDCILWMDSRGARHARNLIAGPMSGFAPVPLAVWVRRTAGAPSTTGADPIGHMLYLLHDEPDVARAARWFLEPVDYLSMRFTGVAAASRASMTGAWRTRWVSQPLALDHARPPGARGPRGCGVQQQVAARRRRVLRETGAWTTCGSSVAAPSPISGARSTQT